MKKQQGRSSHTAAGLLALLLARSPLWADGVPGPAKNGRYTTWEQDGVMISVHRPKGFDAPENTVEMVRDLYLAGADAADCDLRETLDGVLITIHDPMPAGDQTLYSVDRLTWQEVAELDMDPDRFPGCKIPRFEDVVRHALANNMAVYLDEKAEGARDKAKAILAMYGAAHLNNWPLWPRVYHYREGHDLDAVYLRERFGRCEGRVPRELRDQLGETVVVEPGDPRHFRVDDPNVVVALSGRAVPADRTRGPYRPPIEERPIPATTNGTPFSDLAEAIVREGPSGKLAANELCRRFPNQSLTLFMRRLAADSGAETWERVNCLWALGQLGRQEGRPLLRAHLTDLNPRILEAAAYSIGRLCDRESEDLLRVAAIVGDEQSIRAAKWALNRITARRP